MRLSCSVASQLCHGCVSGLSEPLEQISRPVATWFRQPISVRTQVVTTLTNTRLWLQRSVATDFRERSPLSN